VATLLEMKQKSTKDAMKIMQAWLDGKIILVSKFGEEKWVQTRYPSWNFTYFEYRILEEEPAGNDAEEEARVA